MSVRRAVGAIVYFQRDGDYKFVLVHKVQISDTRSGIGERIPGYWDIPKGGLKHGETSEAGVLRELAEELGTTNVRITCKLPYGITFDFPRDQAELTGFTSQTTDVYVIQYLGDVRDIVVDGEKIDEHGIFSYDQARELLCKKETRLVFEGIREMIATWP